MEDQRPLETHEFAIQNQDTNWVDMGSPIPTMTPPFIMVVIAQLVRAPDCDSGGRRFKSG